MLSGPRGIRKRQNPKHDSEETVLWYDQGLHLPTQTISLTGEINETTSHQFIRGLHLLQYHYPSKGVLVLLDTGGGEERAGLAIYDSLRLYPAPVTILVVAAAYSMGAIILQAASTRILMPSASTMIHIGERSYEGHAENVRRELMFDKILDDRCDRILLERMKERDPALSLGKLRDILTLDTYYNAEESVRIGLADSIYTGGG